MQQVEKRLLKELLKDFKSRQRKRLKSRQANALGSVKAETAALHKLFKELDELAHFDAAALARYLESVYTAYGKTNLLTVDIKKFHLKLVRLITIVSENRAVLESELNSYEMRSKLLERCSD